MLDTGGYILKGRQREIIDYMRDVYQIDDIRVRPGGKHLHVEYVYAGQKHKDTLPRGSTPGDRNWVDARKHDLRRYLGEPPAPPTTIKRTLDEMTNELQAKADLLSTTGIGSVIDPKRVKPVIQHPIQPTIEPGNGKTDTAPPIQPKKFPCTIGTLQHSQDIAFYLGKELYDAMERQFGKGRHYVLTYHQPHRWSAHPSRDAGRLIEDANHRLRGGGAEAIRRLGKFPSMKAEAFVRHNRVEFRLLEMPDPTALTETVARVNPAQLEKAEELGRLHQEIRDAAAVVKPVIEEAAQPEPFNPPFNPMIKPFNTPIKTAPPLVIPPPAPPVPPDDPREKLRHVLRLIKQIEDEGTYQLINSNGWRWRAADIGLEDD